MGKLRDRMKADLSLKGYSPHTQRAYLRCAGEFARHFMRSPSDMGEEELRAFLLHLVEEQKVSPAVQGIYLSALKFLYRITLKRPEVVENIPYPKRPKTLPDVLSKEEVLTIFEAIDSLKYKAIIATAYGAGLRISEVCSLRITDIDSKRMLIHIHSGKGKKDRYVMLGEILLELLRHYYRIVRPKGGYLFPGQKPHRPITTTSVSQVMQKVVRKVGLSKRITMDTMRHCFATHLLEAGCDLRVIQALLGHASIRTTVRYTHMTGRLLGHVCSPLDSIHIPPDSPTS